MAAYSVPAGSSSGRSGLVVTDASSFTKLARSFGKVAPESYAGMKVGLQAIAKVVAEDARQRASFSTRIPASIHVRQRAMSIKIEAGGPDAEDAAPLENKGQEGTFRHPLFGNWEYPQVQEAHPFLHPALAAHEAYIVEEVAKVVDAAIGRALGSRL